MDSKLKQALQSEPFQMGKSAEDFLLSGELKLLQDRFSEGLEAFQEAELLESFNYLLYFREGLSLFEYGSEEGKTTALSLAAKKLKKAIDLCPTHAESFHTLASVLTLLGQRHQQPSYFIDAKEKYERALALGAPSADLYWDYAIACHHIGNHSEEPIDLQHACSAFEKALQCCEKLPFQFWIDYGTTLQLLSCKINDIRSLLKAAGCFKQATLQDKTSFESWRELSKTLALLYEWTHDEDHFSQANECFTTAAKLRPEDAQHWLQFAHFLKESAKRSLDIKRMRTSLEKCYHAFACDLENPLILATWAEALALLGQWTERLDLIYEAENKISDALEMCDQDPAIWYSLGVCLCAFGAYFKDCDYYYQAIEKFQTGLSIDRTCYFLWQAIGNAYVAIGILNEDIDSLEQSLKFFLKALSLSASTTRSIEYAIALSKLGEFTHEQHYLLEAVQTFEAALREQKNAFYFHPEWLFSYACTLDLLGDFHDEESYYTKSIEIFSHVLLVDPDFPKVHHRLAQTFCHLGQLSLEIEHFYKAIYHLRLSLKHEEENDPVLLDWGIALMNLAEHAKTPAEFDELMQEAKQKITQSAKLGNTQAYYHLSCLYSMIEDYDRSIYFLYQASHYEALPSIEELLNDEWLEGLRSTPIFREFLAEHPHLQKEC